MLPHPRTLPAGFIQPCLPMKATKPPFGPLWLHEIKHLIVEARGFVL
jgi:hypothetical protein